MEINLYGKKTRILLNEIYDGLGIVPEQEEAVDGFDPTDADIEWQEVLSLSEK